MERINRQKHLSLMQRSAIVGQHMGGLSTGQISRSLNMSRVTVTKWVNRYNVEHSLERRPQPGQKRKLDIIDINDVAERALDTPFINAAVVSREYGVHKDTIRKVWNDIGLNHYIPARKPRLTQDQRDERLGYALQNLNRDWSNVIFSDEKVFQSDSLQRMHLYRPPRSRFDERYVQSIRRSGRVSAGLWGWMSIDGPGEMTIIDGRLNSIGYIEILEENLVRTIDISYGGLANIVFMQSSDSTCEDTATIFMEALMSLQGLGLMDEIAGPRIYTVIKKQMQARVRECCNGKFETSYMKDLMKWLDTCVDTWIDTIYPRLNTCNSSHAQKIKMKKEFTLMLLQVYGKAIIRDMFSIVIEFPDSQPLLEDLRQCMRQVNLRNVLVNTLKSELERRLLNAGVNTSDLLDAYVSTVRALKVLDPSGILVQLVTPPVREYLKLREETVRVILISLTDEMGDLSEELSRNPTHDDTKTRVTSSNWNSWVPDPIDVPKDKHNLRKSDLIQALVSIYGSKTLFIDEYRVLLADRLLRMPKPGSITREIKCLELLKLRFGDSDLQKCEVMLKDVSDSHRLNVRFYEEEGAVLANEDVTVTGLVVSAQFWPIFKQETLDLPTPVNEALEKYTKAFEMIKGNRTLEWQKHIGSVDIELEHGSTKLCLTVNPTQATIIWHFQEKDTWSLKDLAKVTKTPISTLKNRIGFWTSKGILTHLGQDLYTLQDTLTDGSQNNVAASKYVEESDVDSPMTSASSQRETELQMFWSYIEGMLTNLESLPLARIHSMLKLFATVECSTEELQKFLDEKVSQNLLVYSAGQYQLPK